MTANTHTNPFPGLRPFREDEVHLFFGRESQIDAMVDKLEANRFLAVVGTSGSGKSSLVNCGLRPALYGGLMAGAGTAWRMAQFRPGSNPIGEMARALAADGVLFRDYEAGSLALTEIVDTNLRMSKLGLFDIVKQARLEDGVNLLLVVDQFEELFRYQRLRTGDGNKDDNASIQATAFVNLLLEATAQTAVPIYVALTMRSDFLGDCAQFPGLTEAINAGQYLVPRMTRDERRAAISGPVGVGGAQISPVLLTRLVNDVGANPDQLSILQHALNRTWAYWENQGNGDGPLDLTHYEAIGSMAHALDQHAEKAFAELESERQRQICERMFKALTDKATDSRGIRRPTPFGVLCALTDAPAGEVTAVIDVFRKPSRSFLMPPAGDGLEADTVIDISHESLMRVWQRLITWADEEARSAQIYRRLAEAAGLHGQGKESLLRDPGLQLALDWREQNQPNKAWAERYDQPGHSGLDETIRFLTRSSAARDAEQAEEEQRRRRALEVETEKAEAQATYARSMRRWAYVSGALAVFAAVIAIIALDAKKEAQDMAADALWQAGNSARHSDPITAAHNFLRAAEKQDQWGHKITGWAYFWGDTRQQRIEPFSLAAQFASAGLKRSFPHDALIAGVKTNSNEKLVLSWSIDGALKLWNVDEAEPLREWQHDAPVVGALFDRDEQRVLSWDFSGALTLRDVRIAGALKDWKHDDAVNGAVFDKDEQRVLSWSDDGALTLWEVDEAEPLQEWKHDHPVNGALFDKDGKRVLSWSGGYEGGGEVTLWDVALRDGMELDERILDLEVRSAMEFKESTKRATALRTKYWLEKTWEHD